MASDVHSKQDEATCSNKTKPKYKPVDNLHTKWNNTVTQSTGHILLFL